MDRLILARNPAGSRSPSTRWPLPVKNSCRSSSRKRTAAAHAAPRTALRARRRDGADWIGLCRVEPAHRHVDGPGFRDGARTPDQVRQIVAGACAQLSPGPVTAETWGEPPDPYLAMGFDLAEEGGGWELILGR